MNASEKRIQEVLGEDLHVSPNNLRRYRTYLKKSVKFPFRVTGTEDFPWEEPYVMGGWDEEEYEELKKTNPSYTDEFELLDILGPEDYDLVAVIRRTSDKQVFQIGLSWLTCAGKKSANHTMLKDYSIWKVNY